MTDRNRPVAELGLPPSTGAALDRLIAEGERRDRCGGGCLSPCSWPATRTRSARALDEIRGER
ncbi:MAG TPA: hypothetical protein VNV42_14930 [Solirubrobacteraceae bacterium]|nr:hypothetical protein [Solirubrobacteraceae bacterium]